MITKFNETDATYETRPAKAAMTIRHLLTHTSGIGYAFTNPIEHGYQQDEEERVGAAAARRARATKWNYSAARASSASSSKR